MTNSLSFVKPGSLFDIWTDREWSSEQLLTEVQHRRVALLKLGLRVGDRVLIAHGGSPEFFADLLAVWEIGACAVCTDPGLPTIQTQSLVEYSEAKVVLAGIEFDSSLSVDVPILDLSRESETIKVRKKSESQKKPTAVDEALILFTSGTTGAPKGVVLSYGALYSRLELNLTNIDLSGVANVFCPLPTHFGHGLIGNCLTFLRAGCRVLLAPNPSATFLFDFGRIIDEYEINLLSSVPTLWNIVISSASNPSKPYLKRVHIGSAPLSERLWKEVIRWSQTRNVVNMYGLTESANWIAGASAARHEPKDGLVGKLWGGECRLLVGDGEVCKTGEGEILIDTPSLMTGYLKRPDLTESALYRHWFKTGDYGAVDAMGIITLTGRLKFEINRAGVKIQPEDINRVLQNYPSVREAYAFGIPDVVAGEIVGVAVVLEKNKEFDSRSLKTWCQEHLVLEKIPERWFEVKQIPRNDRGKVRRDALISLCLDKNI